MYAKKDNNNNIIETVNDLQFVDNPNDFTEITDEEYQEFLDGIKDYNQKHKLYFETAPVWWSERIKGYGSWQEQLEKIYDGDITTWKQFVKSIKNTNPKTALPQEQVDWLQANGLYEEYCEKYNIEV